MFKAITITDPFNACYVVSRTLLLAHSVTWHLYDEEYRSVQHGVISMTFNSGWSEPKDASKKLDQEAAEPYLQARPRFGARDLGFDSWAGQIGHSVAAVRTFFRSCVAQVLSRGDGLLTRRNTANIKKI